MQMSGGADRWNSSRRFSTGLLCIQQFGYRYLGKLYKSGLVLAEAGLANQEASWLFCSGVRAVMNSSYETTLSSFLSRRLQNRRRHLSLGYVFVARRKVRTSSSVTYPLSSLSIALKAVSSLMAVLLMIRWRTSSMETSHSTNPLKKRLSSSRVYPSKYFLGSDSAP